jgi:hypothetical protein
MELKVGASMVLPKRALRPCKLAPNYQASVRRNMLETIVNANDVGIVSCVEEDGVVRMKIVVKKQDVKQILQVMREDHKISSSNAHHHDRSSPPSSSAEQRLNLLRNKYLLRSVDLAKESRSCSWSPALQSIPEEV